MLIIHLFKLNEDKRIIYPQANFILVYYMDREIMTHTLKFHKTLSKIENSNIAKKFLIMLNVLTNMYRVI